MSSNILISKVHPHLGNEFIAKTKVTKYHEEIRAKCFCKKGIECSSCKKLHLLLLKKTKANKKTESAEIIGCANSQFQMMPLRGTLI